MLMGMFWRFLWNDSDVNFSETGYSKVNIPATSTESSSLEQAVLFLFVFMGMFGGFTAARLFRMFKGTRWRFST